MRTYRVEETPMWPACWYGGPYWNDRRESNSTRYFHRSKELAEKFVVSLTQAARRNAPTAGGAADG